MFSPTLKVLQDSEKWDQDRLIDFQIGKLRTMLRHCAAHVPYYRRLFRKIGFDPESFRALSDLALLPFLDKDTIRANPQDLLADNLRPSQRIYFTTGGTMGQPLGLYNMRHSGGRERAFIFTQWARVGFRSTDRRAMLMGWLVRNQRHWRYDPLERAVVFSNFHMTRDNVARYSDVMRRKKLAFLHCYPSAVVDFIRHLKELDMEPPRFRAILGASENLYPGQKEFIESFMGARLFSWYGHTENVVLAGQCEVSDCYHIFPQYGATEVIREDGQPAENEDEVGELVGSSLDNLAMPLIRYRTSDWAVIGPARCACGRNYRLLKETRGRWHQEMLVGKLDNLISMTALNLHTGAFDNVQQLQFYQREKGRVELRLKRKPEYTDRDSQRILAALEEKMGDTMDISLVFPDEIPLMPRGKFRFIIREFDLSNPLASEVPVETPSR
jgi:phenylacetate-CoA ligase